MAVPEEKKAGQWGRRMANRYYRLTATAVFATTTAIGVILGYCYTRFSFTVAAFVSLLGIGLIWLIAVPLFKQVEKWQKQRILHLRGAQAEALVAWYLNDLTPPWRVFHNLPCSAGGDIDHVVVGPGGLFVISTKSYKGHVTRTASGLLKLNGHPLDDADDAMRCNKWVVDRLKSTLGDRVPWVQPILALPLARIDVPPTEGKVWIVGEENLMETINPDKPKTKLATSKIELIAGELERVRG